MKTMPSEVLYQYQTNDVSVSAVTGGRRMRSNSNITDTISNTFLKKFWTKEKKTDKRIAAIGTEEDESSSASPSPTLFRRNRRSSSVIQNTTSATSSTLSVKSSLNNRSRSPSPSFLRGLGRRSSAASEKNLENLLHYHVSHQDCHALEKLLTDPTHEVDINYMRPPGVSALHQACSQGSIKIVRLLVSFGADIQQKTWTKMSPLKVAVISGSYEVAQFLVQVGANSDDIKDGCQFETSTTSPKTKSKSKRNNSF